MFNKLLPYVTSRNLSLVALSLTCVMGSFLVGVRTVGEVQVFDPSSVLRAGRSEAQQASVIMTPLLGDIDSNGKVDLEDAIALLEVIRGDARVPPEALLTDPDGDQQFTLDDVLWILRFLSNR
ncbi:MAG: hypothetical protein WCV62_00160 [Candidatus Peribacteraceae bacterium]|jgi:hypothetical protein